MTRTPLTIALGGYEIRESGGHPVERFDETRFNAARAAADQLGPGATVVAVHVDGTIMNRDGDTPFVLHTAS